jgi:hypothetical protein
MGIFQYKSVGSTVSGPCSCDGSLCARGGRIDAEALFTEEWSEGGEPGIAGRRVYSGSARSLHEPFDFPVSAILLQSNCTASSKPRISLTTPNHFHALEMATFAPIPYTYVPTAPRSKSAATCSKPAPKPVSILDKI